MGAAPLLTILKNGETIRTCPIGQNGGKQELVVGRGEGCVIRLEDRAISRQHAAFKQTPEGIQVEKKSEFAPLSVNGKPCSRAVVKEGDVISIGPYLIKLTGAAEPAPAPAVQASPAQVPPQAAQSASATLNLNPAAAPEEQPVDQGEPLASPEENGGIPGVDMAAAETPPEGEAAAADPAPPQEGGDLNGLSLGMNGDPAGAGASPQDGPVDLGMMEIAESDAATRVAPLGKVSAKLTFKPGAANVEDFLFTTEELSLGRAKNCDIVLNDKKASRKNTIIRKAGINYIIKDLGSANGTFVNGVQVTEQELSGDDEIQVGDVLFHFKVVSTDYEQQAQSLISVDQDDASSQSLPVPEISSLISTDAIGDPSAAQPQENSRVSLLMNQGAGDPGGIPGQGQGQGLGMMGANSGLTGITGVAGIDGGKSKSIFAKFRALPPRKQAIYGAVGLVAAWYLLFTDPEPDKQQQRKPQSQPSPAVVVKGALRSYDQLKPEEKKYVETKHELAFDYYKNQEFDKALYELSQLFALVADYKNSRELERYAQEGKKLKEAKEEEKRKKEEEAKLKAKVAEMAEEIRALMQKKEYAKAREQFPKILEIDPDNAEIAEWKREIERVEEEKKAEEARRQTREAINQRAWALYSDAKAKFKAGQYRKAIAVLNELGTIQAPDPRVAPSRTALVKRCYAAIAARRDPILQEAKQLEDSGDLAKAYQLYEKATVVDPDHKEGYAGMARLRAILHDRAKAVYTEAVLAESYSDFDTAKKKFKECLDVAPVDDIYHERSERKLARYLKRGESTQ